MQTIVHIPVPNPVWALVEVDVKTDVEIIAKKVAIKNRNDHKMCI